MPETIHESVLLQEALTGLAIASDDTVVDATVGGAGHFRAMLAALGEDGTIIGIDADQEAIARGTLAAKGALPTVHLVPGNFRDLGSILDELEVESVSKVLFDLGWSSYHLTSGRGFTFRIDEPLLMTYGEPEEGTTAADFINSAPEEAISDVLHSLGEERFARHIARGITRTRSKERILTTGALVDVILASTPKWYQTRRLHPATKTFQALRMHVNDELGALRDGLTTALSRLSLGGRVAVISFHSIEDRVVKNMLRDAAHQGTGTLITKKPIEPSLEERGTNPRARSAKLRIFERSINGASPLKSYAAYAYA